VGVDCRIGEPDREIIRALYPALCRFAAIVGSRDMDPEDLVQESLYRTLRHRHLSELASPTAYLRRVIVNVASNQRRSALRRRRAYGRAVSDVEATDAYPSDIDLLFSLTPQARSIVYLHEVEGRAYGEIASLLGCRESSARSIATRARQQLRNLLSEEVHHASA